MKAITVLGSESCSWTSGTRRVHLASQVVVVLFPPNDEKPQDLFSVPGC